MAFNFTILHLALHLSRVASWFWAACATRIGVAFGAKVIAIVAWLNIGGAGWREEWNACPSKSSSGTGADSANTRWGLASLCNICHPDDHDLWGEWHDLASLLFQITVHIFGAVHRMSGISTFGTTCIEWLWYMLICSVAMSFIVWHIWGPFIPDAQYFFGI